MKILSTDQANAQMEAADSPMWIFDQETLAFLAVNDAAVHYYGYSRKEFLKMTILDIRPTEDVAPLVRETLDPGLIGASVRERWRHRTKEGVVFPVEISSWELKFQGRPAELVSVTLIPAADSPHHPFKLLSLSSQSVHHHS